MTPIVPSQIRTIINLKNNLLIYARSPLKEKGFSIKTINNHNHVVGLCEKMDQNKDI